MTIGLVSASVFIVDKSTKFKSRRRQLSTKQDMQKPRFLGTITIFGSIANFHDFVKSAIFQCSFTNQLIMNPLLYKRRLKR